MYPKTAVYVVGHARTHVDNAITNRFNGFFIGFVVDSKDDVILDVSLSATIRTTELFVQSLFVGRKLEAFTQELAQEITRRYLGTSQKALMTAYKDAYLRYREALDKPN